MKPPAFTSDRMRLLGPLVTDKAIALARARVINHRERLSESGASNSDVLVALLLVHEMNPSAHMTNEEKGILRGMDRKTVGRRMAAGEL